jgi:hypothetical protein
MDNDHPLYDLDSFDSEDVFYSEDNYKVHSLDNEQIPCSPSHHPHWSPPSHPAGLPIGQISPGVGSFNSDRSSQIANQSEGSRSNFFVNAVHMHKQENAKIPNYNKAVDRSNSSINDNHFRYGPGFDSSTFRFSDHKNVQPKSDNLLHSLEDFNMAELFLSQESRYRKSLNQNYENRASVIGTSIVGPTSSAAAYEVDDATAMEIDALTAAIDPTPWAEIEDKIHKEAEEQNKNGRVDNHLSNHPHQSSYYPYGRYHQLPIPEKTHSPPQTRQSVHLAAPHSEPDPNLNEHVAQAVATAAAIAAVSDSNTTQSIDRRRVPASTKIRYLSTDAPTTNPSTPRDDPTPSTEFDGELCTEVVPPISRNTHTNNSTMSSLDSNKTMNVPTDHAHMPQQYQRQSANSAKPPSHAAAHSTSRASVLAAASRKSQYGFGNNHIVPSVPAPPPNQVPLPKLISTSAQPCNTNGEENAAVGVNRSISTISPMASKNTHRQSSIPSSVSESVLPPIYSGHAYERKKQKAKDARIKLNDSIDKLSISVSLAGSQSVERINQLQNDITDTNVAYRQRSIESNQECLRLAEQAKKWDRPSFVGTAASLIQALNGQCEALMAELGALHQELVKERNAVSTDATSRSHHGSINDDATRDYASESCPTSALNGKNQFNKRTLEPTSLVSNFCPYSGLSPEPLIKRACLEEEKTVLHDTIEAGLIDHKPLSDEAIIFAGVSRFLDPRSLCRSQCVSKTWKDLDCFRNDNVWLQLLVQRFGFIPVRQWRGKFGDGDEEGGNEVNNKILYREMHNANVMPHVSMHEGNPLKLGVGNIHGKVSAWVFLVERSNGETLRSVKCQPGEQHNGRTYQSKPVVELKFVVQNVGMTESPVVLKDQYFSVDVSTRRTGGELVEIHWDDRFRKVLRNLDGTTHQPRRNVNRDSKVSTGELCCLALFEAVSMDIHIQANGCSTITKFIEKSNFAKILVTLNGTTIPLVVPFLRE